MAYRKGWTRKGRKREQIGWDEPRRRSRRNDRGVVGASVSSVERISGGQRSPLGRCPGICCRVSFPEAATPTGCAVLMTYRVKRIDGRSFRFFLRIPEKEAAIPTREMSERTDSTSSGVSSVSEMCPPDGRGPATYRAIARLCGRRALPLFGCPPPSADEAMSLASRADEECAHRGRNSAILKQPQGVRGIPETQITRSRCELRPEYRIR